MGVSRGGGGVGGGDRTEAELRIFHQLINLSQSSSVQDRRLLKEVCYRGPETASIIHSSFIDGVNMSVNGCW